MVWIGWTRRTRAQPPVDREQLAVSDSALGAGALFGEHDPLFVRAPMPADWERLYGYSPLLLETVVDAQFRGTSYRAANWLYLGETRGRGRMDRCHKVHGRAVKRIYVYPLCRDVQRRLAQDSGFERNKTLGKELRLKGLRAAFSGAFMG